MSKFSGWLSWFKLQTPLPTLPDHPHIPFPEPLRPVAPPQEYAVSATGVAFIKREEGFRANAYLDSAGIPTIGYGTIRIDGKPVTMGMTCTEEQATGWLTYECNGIARALQRMVIVPINQNQIDALTDFCYNLGTDAFRSSSLLRTINTKQTVVEDLFTRWDKIHKDGQVVELEGLKNRRKREYALYTA